MRRSYTCMNLHNLCKNHDHCTCSRDVLCHILKGEEVGEFDPPNQRFQLRFIYGALAALRIK